MRRVLFAGALTVLLLGVGGVGSADAAEALVPWWGVSSGARPTVLAPGGTGEIVVMAQNLGDVGTSGTVTVKDVLPPGLQALGIHAAAGGGGADERGPVKCSVATLTCTYGSHENPAKELVSDSLPPYELIEVAITVAVGSGAESGELNTVSVSGGGAARLVSSSRAIQLGSAQSFGFEDYRLVPENVGGSVDTQAGSHPFQLSTTVAFNNQGRDEQGRPIAFGMPKDVVDELPAGFIGNPTPFAQCTDGQFAKQPDVSKETEFIVNECPAASAIGTAAVQFTDPQGSFLTSTVPIFNVVPRPGEPARFGFKAAGIVSAFLDASVRTGSDYGVNVTSENITAEVSLISVHLTFWGVPGDVRHDGSRGWECMYHFGSCPKSTAAVPPPFLVMPTSCVAPFSSTLRADSWGSSEFPAVQAEPAIDRLGEGVDGCNHLPFAPEVRVTPDGTAASSPTGLNVDVHVPQQGVLNSESLAESAVKDITVALPEGVAVNPSGGDGLAACPEGLVGFTGISGETATFTPTLPEPFQPGVNFCADASKIGTVEIASPLLPAGQHLKGSVYLASQNANPFGSLIALYVVAKDPISGVVVKLTGETRLSDSGQLITTFKNSPQLAFEDAELHFFGGERAPLATPAHCGTYTTNASFTPWSGNEPVSAGSTFAITSGPHGSPCPGASLPFGPSLTGGMTNINAGAFSPLSTTIGRPDGQQDMQSVQLHMPPGLSGLLSGVKLCPEAQANAGSCGPESLIGETTVSAGVGSDPVSVVGGKVYITEHYAGSPFGLSIVNPVKAGPFDLEHDTSNAAQQPACDCVVVRARIDVDPATAALTVTTDPSGPHAIPRLIDGIPVQIQKVNVLVNRPGFTFNPTNCNPAQITGAILSAEGASSPVAVPFQVTNCAVLKYTPVFTTTTAAKATRPNGASLNFKVAYPKNAIGTQTWFNYAKFQIPKQLPARLTTIQKACLAATFATNRGACPAASIIGHAIVHTQVLPVPLEGPVYFVSYGGAKFPDAVVVLKGYGITIELHGHTFIDGKTGITTATFESLPDVPFETIEVTVPQGPFSEFGANLPHGGLNFCGQKLTMPVSFKASNGLEIHHNTPVTITGCPKTKTRAQQLNAALKACHKKHGHKRTTCEQTAHKHYGVKKR